MLTWLSCYVGGVSAIVGFAVFKKSYGLAATAFTSVLGTLLLCILGTMK